MKRKEKSFNQNSLGKYFILKVNTTKVPSSNEEYQKKLPALSSTSNSSMVLFTKKSKTTDNIFEEKCHNKKCSES
jgi:hypothetical protein